MDEFGAERVPASQEAEDLLDLNEVMQAFGVSTWQNQGPLDTVPGAGLHLLVDVQGQQYVLRERPEGLIGEDNNHIHGDAADCSNCHDKWSS